MKKLLAFITAACIITATATVTYADASAEEIKFLGSEWTGTISADTPDSLVVTNSAVISSDCEIINKNIRIEDRGILEITNSAKLVLNNSDIFIENGGTLIISDGALVLNGQDIINNGSVTNVGTLIIGSKGKLDIKKGGFSSTSEGKFINNGRISCVSEKKWSRAISTIKKYDEKFDLSDYSIYIYAQTASSATVQFKYCIDSIETGYKYTAKISNSNVKVTRSSTKLSKVYDKALRNQLLDKVYAYEAANDLPDSFDAGIKRQYYYLYNYSKNALEAEYVFFTMEPDEEDHMVYDNVKTTPIN